MNINLKFIEYAEEWMELNQNGLSLRDIAKQFNTTHGTVSRTISADGYIFKTWHSSKFNDISNVKFGKITALEEIGRSENGEVVWKCNCDCNTNIFFNVIGSDLRRGRKKHCGCNFPKKNDITGETFGFLTVVRDSRKRIHNHVIWECVCICGSIHLVTYAGLTTGKIKSCGCRRPKGSDHHNWTGGDSQVKLYLRSYLKTWKQDSLRKYGFQCVISGSKKRLEVHHLRKSFLEIFLEALELCKLPQLQFIREYSEEELRSLSATCIQLHYQYGLGVPLTTEIHNQFHSMFGRNTTEIDFIKFKNQYLNSLDRHCTTTNSQKIV